MSQDEMSSGNEVQTTPVADVQAPSAPATAATTVTSTAPAASAPAPAPAVTATPSTAVTRSDGVTLLAAYHFIVAALFLLGMMGVSLPAVITAIVGIVEDPEAFIATFILGIIAIVLMLFTTFFLAVGYGLWKRHQWARVAAMVVAVLSLFAVPIGTLIGAFTIWYLIKPEVVQEFEG